jgi:NAD(P)H dehydrogenase (quinone)
MRISVILAHPDKASLNHAITSAAVEQLEMNGHSVSFHDLYAEYFGPLLVSKEIPKDAVLPEPVKNHCEEIRQADGIIVIHPNWWGQPPAILKGWIDRVIRPGIAYEFLEGDAGEGIPKGLLKAEAAIVFNTSNTLPEREQQVFGDPLETIWRNCIFGLCGVGNFHRRTFSTVVTSTAGEREEWLEEARTLIDKLFPKAERTTEPIASQDRGPMDNLQIKLLHKEAMDRLHDAELLHKNINQKTDSGYLLELLAFELLLKTVSLINVGKYCRNHNYQQLYEFLPQKIRKRILDRMKYWSEIKLTNNQLQKLLVLYKNNFSRLRYPFEAYHNMNECEYKEYGDLWTAMGASVDEAEFQYHPKELYGLCKALQEEIEKYLANKALHGNGVNTFHTTT